MKILMIEDNPVDQMLVTQALRRVEDLIYELTICSSLDSAMEFLDRASIDVVLLDLWLPDSEGLDTCHKLVAAVPDTPVVVLTGTDDRALATDAMRSGAQDYLVKGAYPGSSIVRVLQYAIDRFQFQRELKNRENRFQEVLSHLPAIIWTTDSAMTITNIVGAGMEALQLDLPVIVGRKLQDLFLVTGDSPGAIHAHQQALTGQSVVYESAWMNRVFEVRLDPLHDVDHEVVGAVGVALDVTERRRLDREMHFARLVQEELLPNRHPHLDGFEIFGASYPAKQTCGDWFDYLYFPDGSLGLVVGDVSGKGFGPAILSASMAAYLDVLADRDSDLKEILMACNRLLCRRHLNGHFAVLSLGQLHPGVKRVTYGGAGERMLVISSSGEIKQKVASSGFPLGLTDQFPYDEPSVVWLESGDILLLLTDGFREATNLQDVMFGEQRIADAVAANAHCPAHEIFEALRQAIFTFAGGQHQQDDMTGIVVKVLDT